MNNFACLHCGSVARKEKSFVVFQMTAFNFQSNYFRQKRVNSNSRSTKSKNDQKSKVNTFIVIGLTKTLL